METISSLLNYLISIPMFGTQALPGTTILMAKCKSNMTKFGLFWGLKSGEDIRLFLIWYNTLRPRSSATISLGNAVVILGGHSSGNRVSTIGRLQIQRNYEFWLFYRVWIPHSGILLEPSKLCLKMKIGQKLETYREPLKVSVLYFSMIKYLLRVVNLGMLCWKCDRLQIQIKT